MFKDENVQQLRIVFWILKERELYDKFNMYEFWLRFVAFRCHILSDEGIQVDPNKIKAV